MGTVKVAYIMRGVPGSGKSTVAQVLALADGAIHFTDKYFVDRYTGVYRFNPKILGIYHKLNLRAFKKSIGNGVAVVICDNTNIRHSCWKPYADAARAAGYIVAVVSLPHPDPVVAAKRNTHGVSEEAIRKMIDSWEA